MKMTRSRNAVLTHEITYSIQLTPKELYDIRALMHTLKAERNMSDWSAAEWYKDVINDVLLATDDLA